MNAVRKKLNKEDIQKTLMPLFKEYGINKAILFGSIAKGTNNIDSDIDIVVDGGLRGLKFYGFLEKASRLFTNPIDLIEKSQIIANSRIDNEIRNNGVVIYE